MGVANGSDQHGPEGRPLLKTARQELDIINAYEETGSLRAAAALCGTTHKTVKRVLARREGGARAGRRGGRGGAVGGGAAARPAAGAGAGAGGPVHRSDLRQGQEHRREDHGEAVAAGRAG